MPPSVAPTRQAVPRLARAVSLALFAILGPASLAAQDGFIRLGPDLPASTRAMALGGAHVMDGGQSDAIFQHPELLRGASGMALDMQFWGGEGSATSVSAASSWFGGDVGVGIGLQTIQHSQTNLFGPEGHSPQDPLFGAGGVHVSERIASVGFAKGMGDIDWGLAVRLVELRIGNAGKDSDIALAFGASREVGPVTVGVAYRDILTSVSDLTVGVGGYGWQLGILDVGASAHLEGFDDDVRFGGGLEIGYWPIRGRTFVARIGAQNVPDGSTAKPVTMGFAYWGDALLVEWGYQPFDGAPDRGTHRFSVGWR